MIWILSIALIVLIFGSVHAGIAIGRESINKQIKAMSYSDLSALIDETHPDMHLSWNPKKAPIREPKEKKRGVTGVRGVFTA